MNNQLNAELHAELNRAGWMEHKPDLVTSFTEGRTHHSSEMNDAEARELISHIRRNNPKTKSARQFETTGIPASSNAADKMRKKILSMCHKMQWYKRDEYGSLLLKKGKPQLDWERIDNFCVARSHYKKELKKHSSQELPTLVTQFQNVLKSYS